ncbi:hypothetical protein BEH_07825 [Priestia filamentosa]|uniref:Uncharacterized protein n=1 Tax=Priestia filamentosa TaxID=1402861 RepID=A0A0H4KUP0_9BACI|nr:hypothetical protein [Priestia filamentosa]AKO92018.1 hypothetical protein BEH_07825 [Priestia filamentosa]
MRSILSDRAKARESQIHNELGQLKEHLKREDLTPEAKIMINERQQELLGELNRLMFSPTRSDRIKELEDTFDKNEARLTEIDKQLSEEKPFTDKFTKLHEEKHNLLRQQKWIPVSIESLIK